VTGTIPTAGGDIDAPSRALVVVAHPDDIDFGTAGTVAAMTSAGTHVSYCLVTSGEAGDDDLSRSSFDLAQERESEQTAAAGEVGVNELYWLHHPDGRVVADLELRRDISRVIRQTRPDVVLTQSTQPDWDRIYGSHPDHLATAWATMAAIYPDSRNPRAHPELLRDGLKPHKVAQAWIRDGDPDLYVDITNTFAQKVAALARHRSQVAWMSDLPGMLRKWAEATAEKGGMKVGRVAEAFRVINTL
jgi:LmbE family N-acetylglucosaminyl deacetylase